MRAARTARRGGKRFTSEAQLVTYADIAPLKTGSAGKVRLRLNRGSNRRLNAILCPIALAQARWSAKVQAYLTKRQRARKSRREAIRAFKRFLVRAT